MKKPPLLILFFVLLHAILSCAPAKRVEGVVLSDWDHIDNWEDVNVGFIYARATSGENVADEYEKLRDNAKKQDIPFGAYCLYDDSEGGSAYWRFKKFKSVVPKESVDLIPALFVNYPRLLQNKEQFIAEIREWIKLCKDYYGVYPIVFCTEKGLFKQLNVDGILIWSSSILGESPIESAKIIFYKSDLIPGFKEEVSCVYLNGSIDDIRLTK